MKEQVQKLLEDVGPGKMSSLAYDTAWLARLGEIEPDLSNKAINWLCENQLPDGSWGARQPVYYHDRVISTLSAMTALTYRGRRSQDRAQIDRGLLALERIASDATRGLQADHNGATVGFEMIVPTLVSEAEQQGIMKHQGERVLGKLSAMRSEKLSKIQGKLINRNVTMAFSAEMAGLDGQHLLDLQNLQEANGSVGNSPSATAYYVINVAPDDTKAVNYLREVASEDGGAQDLYPFDLYERAWVLWNLNLFPHWDKDVIQLFNPHLEYLRSAWKEGEGIGFSASYSVPDGDDTIIAYELLRHFDHDVDIEAVLSFEEDEYFRCYQLEVGRSPSVNIHALLALYKAGYDLKHPKVQKILRFLENQRGKTPIWVDKWHSSPYYSTSHFVIAICKYDHHLAEKTVEWIISNQRMDGSWGYVSSTAEETAYCLQALTLWHRKTGKVPLKVIRLARNWLNRSMENGCTPLWIGKGLYSADHVVRSAILSAIMLSESI